LGQGPTVSHVGWNVQRVIKAPKPAHIVGLAAAIAGTPAALVPAHVPNLITQ